LSAFASAWLASVDWWSALGVGVGIDAWLSWEEERARWHVPVEISREDLAALVERSTVALVRRRDLVEVPRSHPTDW
jgi:hypothetical protein